MKRKLDLIIFDLDGTLYPANKDLDRVYPRAAIQLLARRTGRDIPEVEAEFLEKKAELGQILKGKPTSTLTLFYFYEVGFAEFENSVNAMIEIEKYIKPDPEAVRTIKKIHDHYPLFLYTTNNGKVSDRILNYLDLSGFFPAEKRFTFSDAGNLPLPRKEKLAYVKPGSKGFAHILKMHGASPDRTLMVGDSEVSDMNPARQAGLLTYHITDRQSFYQLPAWLGI